MYHRLQSNIFSLCWILKITHIFRGYWWCALLSVRKKSRKYGKEGQQGLFCCYLAFIIFNISSLLPEIFVIFTFPSRLSWMLLAIVLSPKWKCQFLWLSKSESLPLVLFTEHRVGVTFLNVSVFPGFSLLTDSGFKYQNAKGIWSHLKYPFEHLPKADCQLLNHTSNCLTYSLLYFQHNHLSCVIFFPLFIFAICKFLDIPLFKPDFGTNTAPFIFFCLLRLAWVAYDFPSSPHFSLF